jgi:hypothetical protein
MSIKEVIPSIRKGTITGAIAGVCIAIILLFLDHLRLFAPNANAAIERLTFRLCPLYILGFANGMGSMTVVIIVTILGNAVLYGIALGVLAVLPALFQRQKA